MNKNSKPNKVEMNDGVRQTTGPINIVLKRKAMGVQTHVSVSYTR